MTAKDHEGLKALLMIEELLRAKAYYYQNILIDVDAKALCEQIIKQSEKNSTDYLAFLITDAEK
jgi:hypothetical protein